MGAEKFVARAVKHEARQDRFCEEIKRLIQKSKPDTRRINTDAPFVLEKGEVLVELKRKGDEAEAKTAKKVKKSETPGETCSCIKTIISFFLASQISPYLVLLPL